MRENKLNKCQNHSYLEYVIVKINSKHLQVSAKSIKTKIQSDEFITQRNDDIVLNPPPDPFDKMIVQLMISEVSIHEAHLIGCEYMERGLMDLLRQRPHHHWWVGSNATGLFRPFIRKNKDMRQVA